MPMSASGCRWQAASSHLHPRAIQTLHRLSGGIPRLINLICDRALIAAFARGSHKIVRGHQPVRVWGERHSRRGGKLAIRPHGRPGGRPAGRHRLVGAGNSSDSSQPAPWSGRGTGKGG